MNEKPRRENNALSQLQAGRLYVWLENNRVEASTHSAAEVASSAGAALGFSITESNVGHARRALGIFRPRPEPADGLAQEVRDLRRDLRTLARLVAEWLPSTNTREMGRILGIAEQPTIPGVTP